jgi:porin
MKKIITSLFFLYFSAAMGQQTGNKFSEQPTLTGDRFGVRPWLADHGIKVQPRITSFYEEGFGGKKNNLEFGGKADLQITLNGEKMGLWKGLNLVSHLEYNFGHSPNEQMRTLLPQNTALFLPGINGANRFDISSLYLLQKIGKNKVLMAGKINMVDVASGSTFMGGAGIENFEHIAFVAPPSGLIPPYLFGALFSIKTQPMNYTFMIFDPVSAVNKSGLETPFKKGITFFGSVERPVKFGDKTGAHSLKAVYSTQHGLNLTNLSDVILQPELQNDKMPKKSRYYFGYSFHQHLVQSREDTSKGWGIFGNIGISDGNPTPLDWSFVIGLGGNSLFKGRKEDQWGIGYFHYSITNSLRNAAAVFNRTLENESGAEVFYNYQLVKWFNIGVNAKLINPAFNFENSKQDSYFLGLRTSIKL